MCLRSWVQWIRSRQVRSGRSPLNLARCRKHSSARLAARRLPPAVPQRLQVASDAGFPAFRASCRFDGRRQTLFRRFCGNHDAGRIFFQYVVILSTCSCRKSCACLDDCTSPESFPAQSNRSDLRLPPALFIVEFVEPIGDPLPFLLLLLKRHWSRWLKSQAPRASLHTA
jgi:hypothetical protein